MAALIGVTTAAAGISLAVCLFALWAGPRLGFMDHPDPAQLKTHERPAVPLGGLGVFTGLHAAMAVGGVFDRGFFLVSALVLVLGLADDRWSLSPGFRFASEFVVGLVLVVGTDVAFTRPGDIVFGTLLVVVSINAVNMLDGLDGLAGTVGLVAGLGAAALGAGRGLDPGVGLALAGALGGFLVLNWRPARLFMGDNGAYTVGLTVAYAILRFTPAGWGPGILVATGLLGVFALDLGMTILRRVVNRQPITPGDRSHVYDQLHQRGLSIPAVAVTAGAVQAIMVAGAVGADLLLTPVAAAVAVVALGVVGAGALSAAGFLRVDQSP